MTAVQRREIVEAVEEAIRGGARQFKCCEALSLCERRLERWRKEKEDRRIGGYRAKGQMLSAQEYGEATLIVKQAMAAHKPLRAVHAELLDKGHHVASPTTFYRIRKDLLQKAPRPLFNRKPRRRTRYMSGRRETPLTVSLQ